MCVEDTDDRLNMFRPLFSSADRLPAEISSRMSAMATVLPSRQVVHSLIIEAQGQRRRVPISKTPFAIGRADDCDAIIPDFRVSRLHAKILSQGDQYSVEDAQSRHGTFVNSVRCQQRTAINPGDEITLGAPGIKIIFAIGEVASSAANVLLSRLVADSDTSELEKLRLFLEATRTMGSGMVVTDVLRKMLDVGLRLTRAERGFVYLRQKDGTPQLACGLDAGGTPIMADRDVSHSVVQEAMSSAAEFITGDSSQQSALAARQSIVLNELKTLVAIPLRVRRLSAVASPSSEAEVSGVLYLDSRSVTRNLSGVSNDVLRALASECAAVLESAMLVETEQATRQYQQEMEIAASIQRSLISVPDVRCDFANVSGRSIPCKEVGGDFFDVNVSPQAVTVIVADVSGKGISAALLASVIHGMFYAQIVSGTGLVDAITSVNRFLCSRVAGQKYATLLAAQLSRDGMLQIVNCGHVPAIIVEDGKVTHVEDGDLPVGLIAQARFHSVQRQLPAGSRVVILTDGISETENVSGAEFGTAGLEPHLRSPDPVPNILTAVQIFSGGQEAQDDRTLVVLERTA
jgi:serine phosphatase RsbU (regulator of sigma subunit)/pSer/pThr/pTyr-binding forkhead associated (FHA) protein